jgi:osmoprotectant transport system substrate-binding protein
MGLMSFRREAAKVVLAAFLSLGLVTGTALAQPVRVASKIDTEGALLGQLIVQLLEAGGVKTENRLQLGNTQIVRRALVAGEIDLYPEYTGNGAFFHADEKNPAWKQLDAGWQRVRTLDADKHQLTWLAPAPANNTWAIAVRKDVAAAQGLKSLVDFGRWVSAGGQVKLAASAEFAERPDALPAFQAAYGFKLNQNQLLLLAGGDTATTLKAAAQRTSGVNAAMAYGTDGPVAALGLVVLEDPLGAQPVYAPAPVVRADVLKRQPQIATLLAPLFRTLDTATLQRLNAQIAIEGQDARRVAAAHLKATGLVK